MLFARLRRALGRQDWVAVLLEVAIVVTGVVIGFQITAWGQRRTDAATERAYLVQIAEDMRQTERRIARADSSVADVLRAQVLLLRAYRTPERPAREEVGPWLSRAFNYAPVAPIVGTTQALIATGDLALVRDDSLRAAIPAYLEETQTQMDSYAQVNRFLSEALVQAQQRVDLVGASVEGVPQALIDSLAAVPDSRLPLPAGPRRTPFPFDVEEVLTDPELFAALNLAYVASTNMERTRRAMIDDARGLRARVERVLEGP